MAEAPNNEAAAAQAAPATSDSAPAEEAAPKLVLDEVTGEMVSKK